MSYISTSHSFQVLQIQYSSQVKTFNCPLFNLSLYSVCGEIQRHDRNYWPFHWSQVNHILYQLTSAKTKQMSFLQSLHGICNNSSSAACREQRVCSCSWTENVINNCTKIHIFPPSMAAHVTWITWTLKKWLSWLLSSSQQQTAFCHRSPSSLGESEAGVGKRFLLHV